MEVQESKNSQNNLEKKILVDTHFLMKNLVQTIRYLDQQDIEAPHKERPITMWNRIESHKVKLSY